MKKAPTWLLIGVLILIILAQTQCALTKNDAKALRDGPFLPGAEALAAVLFGLWAIWALATGQLRKIQLPPLAAWAFIAVAVIAVGRADSGEALKSGVIDVAQFTLYFLCLYTLLLNVLSGEGAIKKAITVIAICTVAMVLMGLVQYAVVADPARASETFPDVHSTFGLGEYVAGTVIGGKLALAGPSSRSIYCNYLLMVLPILFALGMGLDSPKWLKPALLATVGVGALTMLSGLHFWALVAIVLALSLRRGMKTTVTLAAVVLVFTIASPFAFKRNWQANIVEVLDFYEEGVFDEAAAVDEGYEGGEDDMPTTTEVKKRWIEWQPALNMLGESPALGVGTGGYQLHIGPMYGMLPNFKKIEPDTNCGWLVIAASMGLCGFIALVALFYSRYRAATEAAETAASPFLRALALGLSGGILGLIIANVFSGVLVRGLSITVILILALATAIERMPKADERADEDETTETEALDASETPTEGD